eukprot:gene16706-22850_t
MITGHQIDNNNKNNSYIPFPFSTEILKALTSDWLSMIDLCHLDSSFCDHEFRPLFLSITNIITGHISFRGIVEAGLSKFDYKNLIQWIIRRNISVKDLIINNEFQQQFDDLKTNYYYLQVNNSNEYVKLFYENIINCSFEFHFISNNDEDNNNNFTKEAILFNKALQSIQNMVNLRSISFKHAKYHISDDIICNSIIHQTKKSLSKLESINMNQCELLTQRSILNICKFMSSSLTHLNISQCDNINNNDMILIFTHLTCLLSLDISECSYLSDESIASSFPIPTVTNNPLISLNVSRCLFSDDGIIRLSEHIPSLTYLNISHCYKLTDMSIIDGITHYLTNLIELHASRCYNITDDGLMTISYKLLHLSTLNVSGCYLLTNYGINFLTSFGNGLHSLDLNGCCDHITNQTISNLVQNLPNLTSLGLRGCACTTDREIICMMIHLKYLKRLDISGSDYVTSKSIINLIYNLRYLIWIDVSACYNIAEEDFECFHNNNSVEILTF